MNHAERFLRY